MSDVVKSRPTSASHKIRDTHLQLDAVIYVRQSANHQMLDHQESTARQYALKDRVLQLGWQEEQVVIIDDDLGISGTGRAERPGFRRLLKLVTEQQVGIVVGLEMSRLARNSKDWSDLFEVCAIFQALLADEDGVFEPNDPNDRLVLGLKGILSEMELHTMKVRLERGRLNKARRGDLFADVPVGFVRDEKGLPQLDPDESARHAVRMFFELFQSVGSSQGLFRYLAEHDLKLPFRQRSRLGSPIEWRVPAMSSVYEMLRHPLYAGCYSFGRKKSYKDPRLKRRGEPKHLPPEQWQVCIQNRYPGYITWEQFERNQQRLSDNCSWKDRTGPVRQGSALLGGIIFCKHCGRRMSPRYTGKDHGFYDCSRHRTVTRGKSCGNHIGSKLLDAVVADKLLEALEPGSVDLSLRVVEDEATRRQQLETLLAQRVQQAVYAAELAERRYKEVDPANRLVARTLERDWNAALQTHQSAAAELEQMRLARPVMLGEEERRRIHDACRDVRELWHSRVTLEQRKQVVRLLLERVEVDVHNDSDRTTVAIHWSGGFESCFDITRNVVRFDQMESYEQLLERTLEMAKAGMRAKEIAPVLAKEGFHSPMSATSISRHMVAKLMNSVPRCIKELRDPDVEENQWQLPELAKRLGVSQKRVKNWVQQGLATAAQRPFGRMWVICADDEELRRLGELASRGCGG